MRIRNIKPGFWTNEALADCSDRQNLLFIGLWMLADKNGCLEFRMRRIKAELFALRDYTTEELLKDCGRLSEVLLINFYRVCGGDIETEECKAADADFIYIPNFIKHQRLTTWEKSQSEAACPLPLHLIPNPPDFRSTSEALLPEDAEVGSKGEAEITEVGSKAATSHFDSAFKAFQAIHPSCSKVGRAQFDASLAAARTTAGWPDVEEAVAAFTRHMAGVTMLNFPLREFDKYLRRAAPKPGEKKNRAGLSPMMQEMERRIHKQKKNGGPAAGGR